MSGDANTIQTLSLQFDGQQLSQVLMYGFTHMGNPSFIREGLYAGCAPLLQGDRINIEITMTSVVDTPPTYEVKGLEIVGLDLVSKPNVKDSVMPLSPFDIDQATKNFQGTPAGEHNNWSDVQIIEEEGITKYLSHLKAEYVPTIEADYGFWEISGFLSVKVIVKQGGAELAIPRVFSFDPEATGGRRDP